VDELLLRLLLSPFFMVETLQNNVVVAGPLHV